MILFLVDMYEHAVIYIYNIYIIYIYGPASLGTPPPPTPWLWVCIVAPQYPLKSGTSVLPIGRDN